MPRAAMTKHDEFLNGRKSKARPNDEPGTIPPGRPKPPQHLSPEALIEFKRISKILGKRQTETPGDYSTLAVYAEVYSRWVEAKRTLQAEGLQVEVTVTDNSGQAFTNKKINPLLRVVETCEGRILTLAKAIGITPDTRDRVKPAKEPATPKQPTAEDLYFDGHPRVSALAEQETYHD